MADKMVLEANKPGGLRTCSLRIGPVYGKLDSQMTPGILHVLEQKQQRNQIGNNQVLMDFVSVNNATKAHILAYRALISESISARVAGEGFFITDGKPVPFWDFSRKVWAAAGDKTPPEKVRVIPAGLVLGLSLFLEWVYWVFTFGQRSPAYLKSYTVRYVSEERTFSIKKARDLLGYEPVDDMDQSIKDAVALILEEEQLSG